MVVHPVEARLAGDTIPPATPARVDANSFHKSLRILVIRGLQDDLPPMGNFFCLP